MSDWKSVKAMYLVNKNTLDDALSNNAVTNMVNDLNKNISIYTNRAGISQSSDPTTTDPAYQAANTIFQNLQTMQQAYVTINNNLSKNLTTLSSSADLQGKLGVVGKLQEDIKNLKKEVEEAKQDSDTSKTRQSTLEAPQSKISMYQGIGARLGFVKPLYQTSIPFLLGFGILLLFLSALILREFFLPGMDFSSSSSTTMNTGESSIVAIFRDSRFLAASGGMTFVVAILLILSLSGYLGKNVR